jgi:hypothetical protein
MLILFGNEVFLSQEGKVSLLFSQGKDLLVFIITHSFRNIETKTQTCSRLIFLGCMLPVKE